MAGKSKIRPSSPPKLSREILWAFRPVSVIGLPLFLFLAIALSLYLLDFDDATAFLFPDKISGEVLARQPDPALAFRNATHLRFNSP